MLVRACNDTLGKVGNLLLVFRFPTYMQDGHKFLPRNKIGGGSDPNAQDLLRNTKRAVIWDHFRLYVCGWQADWALRIKIDSTTSKRAIWVYYVCRFLDQEKNSG